MIGDAKLQLAQEAQKLIEETYKEKFSLQMIADTLYVNRSYISRVFAQVSGMTLVRYHNFIRCQQSLAMLDNPGMKIEHISETVGYASLSHYIKEFKRTFHMTPSQYRKKGEVPADCRMELLLAS